MTKWNISFEGDIIDDKEDLDAISKWPAMCSAIHNAKQSLRSRDKHGKDVSDEESRWHDELSEILYSVGLE